MGWLVGGVLLMVLGAVFKRSGADRTAAATAG
jgi:hypothetical protein